MATTPREPPASQAKSYLGAGYYMDKETEAQRREVTHPKTQLLSSRADVRPRVSDSTLLTHRPLPIRTMSTGGRVSAGVPQGSVFNLGQFTVGLRFKYIKACQSSHMIGSVAYKEGFIHAQKCFRSLSGKSESHEIH